MSSRWVQIDGLHNVRDLGGVPLPGGATAYGVVLRGETLVGLTGRGADDVRHLGVRHVLDLRSVPEREADGDGLLAADYQRSLLLHEHVPLDAPHETGPFGAPDETPTGRAERFVAYLHRGSFLLADALARTAWSTSASYVHGAAGCDRTGVVSALLLELAGAARDDIVDDYLLSGQRLPRVLVRLAERPAYWDLALTDWSSTEPSSDAMARYLDDLAAQGGARAWLERHAVDPETVDLLATRLRGEPMVVRDAG